MKLLSIFSRIRNISIGLLLILLEAFFIPGFGIPGIAGIAFILLPEGNSSGDEKFTGTGIITGMSVTNGMDAIISRSVTFQGTGTLTRGTV